MRGTVAVTVSEMAVPNGSPMSGVDSPRVLTRARARPSVTRSDTARPARAQQDTAARGSAVSRLVRVAYLDAADSWIVSDSTPSIKAVWRTDYAAAAPGHWLPFVIWCKAYRLPAVALATLLDAIKWMLIHPLRGPLFLSITGGLVAAWTI